MSFRLDDYIDADVAYLAGLIVARGTISSNHFIRQLVIEFPYSSLVVEGTTTKYNQEDAILLGLIEIRERLLELLNTDIFINRKDRGIDFVIRFTRNNMIWRNIVLLTEGKTSYQFFKVPPVFFDPQLPQDWKREFIRGYADVAGNIRHSNRYTDNRHRVRIDVLNYPQNWEVPVQICTLLQEHLDVPVQLIAWGHPNLGRSFREHQVNIFAKPFLKIGFSLKHKQQILEEFVAWDEKNTQSFANKYSYCPGYRRLKKAKPNDPDEYNKEKLDDRLFGKHFDAYWQICRELGCKRAPLGIVQTGFDADSLPSASLLDATTLEDPNDTDTSVIGA